LDTPKCNQGNEIGKIKPQQGFGSAQQNEKEGRKKMVERRESRTTSSRRKEGKKGSVSLLTFLRGFHIADMFTALPNSFD